MSESEHIIGIDLGTTNSVVAVLEGEQPRVIANSEGFTKTPSVVSFMDNGDVLVGELARRQGAINPQKTISSVKRLMGRNVDDVQAMAQRIPFQVTMADGQMVIRAGDSGFTPPQISAFILKKLRQSAEDYLGETVDKALITVPAYFDDLQRQATMEAGRLAGLTVLRLVNEPTAAAMAYGLGRGEDERVVIYDLGGGTFDITVLDISANTFEVLTSTGDTHLGGDDFDDLIMDLLIRRFAEQIGAPFEPDTVAVRRLREAAEKAKCELSVARQTPVQLPFLAYKETTPVHFETVLTRAQLEELICPLAERTIDLCREALRDCGLSPQDINKVILVGGSTRIPLVQELVEDFFGMPPFKGINPDEIVAMGAATQAGVLGGKLKEVLLLDVTPHSLGIEVADNRVSRVIEKNSTIPIKAAKLFTTAEDNQELVMVHVVQGEHEKATENRSLGKFSLAGIEAAKAGTPRIQVVFHINADGMVEVLAEDMNTRQQKAMVLTISSEDTASPARRRVERRRRARRPARETAQGGAPEVITAPAASQTQARQASQIAVHGAADTPAFQPLPPGHSVEMQPVRLEPQAPPPQSAFAPPPAPASEQNSSLTTETQPMSEDLTPKPGRRGAGPSRAGRPPPPGGGRAGGPARGGGRGAPPAPLSESASLALKFLSQGASNASALTVYVKAADEIRRRAETDPDDDEMLEAALKVLLFTGEPDKACAMLLAAAGGAAKPERLASLFDLYLDKFPEDEEAIAGRAELLARMKLLEVAITDFERICSENRGTDAQVDRLIELYNSRLAERDDPDTQFKLVKLLVRRNRIDDAVNILQQLSLLDSYRSRALQILGLCFWQKGMHYLAWQKFQHLTLTEEIKDILYRLAADMEDTEQLLNAKSVWQHLDEADPTYRDVAQRMKKVDTLMKAQSESFKTEQAPGVLSSFKNSRFVILEEVNRGSMGIVYRAKDKVLEEIVALKVLNDYMTGDPQAVERFKREARAAKKLSHPNIVRIHDMFEIGTKRLLSMEFIEGRDLKKILLDRKRLPGAEVVAIAMSACDALAYAHQIGIVHRDIKPANIMITTANQVKVTDFGIAKFLLAGPEVTRSGSQILGTPLYMSPEQIRGDRVDARADIYSLGATLYEMAGGRPPFFEGNIEYHHLHTPPSPLPADVPPALADAIQKCLAKEPADRFQTIDQFRDALARVTIVE